MRVEPKFYKEYREPFVGGGGVFFAVRPSVRRWINDYDEHLISVYEALRDEPEAFIARCREIPVCRSKDNQEDRERLSKKFQEIAFDDECNKSLRFFFVNRTVWGGRVNYERKSRLYFSKPEGWTEAILNRLEEAAAHLQGVTITCGDYGVLLLTEGEDVWVYCDPPYYKPGLKSTSLLYRHNFEKDEQHLRLANLFFESPHKVCVSYEDGDFIRSIFSGKNRHTGFETRFITEEWTYAGTATTEKRIGKELLILNYDPSN